MRLCAIVKNGKIKGVAPVRDRHDFGDRDGYSHIEVMLLDELPKEFDGPKIIRGVKDIVIPLSLMENDV